MLRQERQLYHYRRVAGDGCGSRIRTCDTPTYEAGELPDCSTPHQPSSRYIRSAQRAFSLTSLALLGRNSSTVRLPFRTLHRRHAGAMLPRPLSPPRTIGVRCSGPSGTSFVRTNSTSSRTPRGYHATSPYVSAARLWHDGGCGQAFDLRSIYPNYVLASLDAGPQGGRGFGNATPHSFDGYRSCNSPDTHPSCFGGIRSGPATRGTNCTASSRQ
jgi:hypothetical protein